MENLYGESSEMVKVGIPSSPEEDKFWVTFGQSLISETINVLDARAQFMITTSASLLTADFAILVITSKIAAFTVSPQFFFALSALCFILSLFPKRYAVNPWVPDETRSTYFKMLNRKHKYHLAGFLLLFIGLILVVISSFLTFA